MTILFQNDWTKVVAQPDYNTTNDTFLKIARLYKDMGVKNYLFPLSLHQPELSGVDPHDPNLDMATKMKIITECRYNYWYFIREVVRIPNLGGSRPLKYIANRGNIAVAWCYLNHVDVALIQPRQTGKSVSTDCLMIWLMFIGAINSYISLITLNDKLRNANIDRLKQIRDLLPGYLLNTSSRDADNKTGLSYKQLNNTYVTNVGGTSRASANNLGRGTTSATVHVDEGPFISFIEETIPALLAATTKAREMAAQDERPYGNVFTTTAGKRDTVGGAYLYDMIHDGTTWREMYLDAKDPAELMSLLKQSRSGKKNLVNITLGHRQLGYTDEWLYTVMAETGSKGDKADRDFFNVWTFGTQASPLSVELNGIISDSVRDPVYIEITRHLYTIDWYIPEEEVNRQLNSRGFVVGLDTSDAIGRDAIVLVVLDPEDLSVVGMAIINETNLLRFSQFLVDFMVRYSRTVLIPERKSSGPAIIDALLLQLPSHGIDPCKRIFNMIVEKGDENPTLYRELQKSPMMRTHNFFDLHSKYFGFNTNADLRDQLYSNVLPNAAKNAGHLVRSATLAKEIRGLVVKNGRIDHSSSGHDDACFSWLMAHWMLRHAHNLAYYGIDTKAAFSRVVDKGKALDPREQRDREKQARLRQELDIVYEELSNTDNEFIIARLESRLRAITSRMRSDTEEIFSVDDLLKQANEQRQQRRREQKTQNRFRQQLNRYAA